MAALTYMQRRRSGIYEFRKRLPKELAGKPVPAEGRVVLSELINTKTGRFKGELTISLGTHDTATAKRLDLREAHRVTELFEIAKRIVSGERVAGLDVGGVLTPAEIERDTITHLLREDDREREDGDARRHMQTPEERAQWPALEPVAFGTKGMAESHLEVMGDEIEMMREDYRNAFARRDPSIVRAELHVFLKANHIPIDPSSPFYREAGLAVLKGHVSAYNLLAQRQAGDDIETPLPEVEKGPLLSEAHTHWQEGSPARGGKTIAPNTRKEAERAVRYFTQWFGNLRLGEITKEKARDFRDSISRMPIRLSIKERSVPLRVLLERDHKGRDLMHAASVNKYLNLMSAIVTAAERDGRMDRIQGFVNPFNKMSLAIDRRSVEAGRRAFTETELKVFLQTAIYTQGDRPAGGAGEASYWFPLIALLSGARLNEIAQLRLKDLRKDPETGIWFIDIGTEGGRAIKTAGSRRQVPLHSELKRLGLLRYRQTLIDAKPNRGLEATLWPHVKSADRTYRSAAWSKWFGRFLRDAGLEDQRLVFHSFRHTFKRLARDAGLSEEMHDALTGHAGSGSVGRSYGAGFGLNALADAMGRIEAPQSVQALREARPSK